MIASVPIGSASSEIQAPNLFDQPPSAQPRVRVGTKKRIIASAIAVGVIVVLVIVYNCWDSWIPSRSAAAYTEPSNQTQVADQSTPITSTPTPPQAAAPTAQPIFHTDPRFPGMRYAAPGAWAGPPGAAAPQSTQPQGTSPQVAMTPSNNLAPPSQPTQQATMPAPQEATPDPNVGYQQAAKEANAEYASAIKYYNDALYRLKNLNGAGMSMDQMSIDQAIRSLSSLEDQCSPGDRPKVEILVNDLVGKSSDIRSAAQSSPTGGQ